MLATGRKQEHLVVLLQGRCLFTISSILSQRYKWQPDHHSVLYCMHGISCPPWNPFARFPLIFRTSVTHNGSWVFTRKQWSEKWYL